MESRTNKYAKNPRLYNTTMNQKLNFIFCTYKTGEIISADAFTSKIYVNLKNTLCVTTPKNTHVVNEPYSLKNYSPASFMAVLRKDLDIIERDIHKYPKYQNFFLNISEFLVNYTYHVDKNIPLTKDPKTKTSNLIKFPTLHKKP